DARLAPPGVRLGGRREPVRVELDAEPRPRGHPHRPALGELDHAGVDDVRREPAPLEDVSVLTDGDRESPVRERGRGREAGPLRSSQTIDSTDKQTESRSHPKGRIHTTHTTPNFRAKHEP